jgi:putative two-component system response regulator
MSFTAARILIVDDGASNVLLLERLLERGGYQNKRSVLDSRQAVAVWEEWQPDLLLLDLQMPNVDGFDILTALKQRIPESDYMPVLVLTANALPDAKKKALSLGAKDFLTKPFDAVEVLLRIGNLLQTRFLHLESQQQNANLEVKVAERTRELEEAQVEMLDRLALASDSRDDETGEHTRRVGELSAALALTVGWPEVKAEQLRRSAALHDIGKIAIPDGILLKPGKLTVEEFEVMKTHAVEGARILSGSRYPVVQMAEEIAMYHHEKWAGNGYKGLKGEAIPESARIVAVADVFDVLTHERPYKRAWPIEEAYALMTEERGRHFAPQVVDALFELRTRGELVCLAAAVAEAGVGAGVEEQEEQETALLPVQT